MPRSPESKLVPWGGLADLSRRLHTEKQNIVTTNGCFDLLHWGHIRYLNEARALGDCLVIGINSDASVRRSKGSARPINSQQWRALQLASLEAVDYVLIFEEATPERFLEILRPSIHVKGGDYLPENLPERRVVEAHGGKVHCLSFVPGISTTALIEKLKTY